MSKSGFEPANVLAQKTTNKVFVVLQNKLDRFLSRTNYLDKHQSKTQYADYQNNKLMCGSGIIESGIRRIVNLRFKSPGIFWYEENV